MPYSLMYSYVMNDVFPEVGIPAETRYGFQYDNDGKAVDDPCTFTIYKKGRKRDEIANSGPIDLTGKVAVVTGGARGIGRATSLALAREGARIVVCDVLPVEETVAEVQKRRQKTLGLIGILFHIPDPWRI